MGICTAFDKERLDLLMIQIVHQLGDDGLVEIYIRREWMVAVEDYS